MAWIDVEVKANKSEIRGMLRGNELQIPNGTGRCSSLIISGSTREVESWESNDRNEFITVMLATASGKKEESNDKPTQRRS